MPQSDWVIVTNNNPGTENPPDIIADVVAGFPEEVLSRHAGSVYPWLQDVGRIPSWFEPFHMNYQFEVRARVPAPVRGLRNFWCFSHSRLKFPILSVLNCNQTPLIGCN